MVYKIADTSNCAESAKKNPRGKLKFLARFIVIFCNKCSVFVFLKLKSVSNDPNKCQKLGLIDAQTPIKLHKMSYLK